MIKKIFDSITSDKSSPLWMMLSSMLIVGLILAILLFFDAQVYVFDLLEWFDARGAEASLLFILVMALIVVFLLPGVLFTTGAGFVFGLIEGTIYVVLGTTLGAGLAFLIARYLFGKRAVDYLLAREKLGAVSKGLSVHGWKFVLLTRLIPFFPSKISNYLFGLMPLSFRGYLSGSFIGFIPFSLHNVYLGSIAADIATLGERNTDRTTVEWAVYGFGFVATVIAVVFISRVANKALRDYSQE